MSKLALAALVLCAACSRDRDKPRATQGSAVPSVRADAGTPVAGTLDTLFLTTLARVTKRPVTGSEIKSGTHTIRLATTLENDLPRPPGHAVGVAVDVIVDGRSVGKLRTGSVGIGRTRDEALLTAASEWVAEFGVPIVGAYDGTPPSFEMNGLKVYAGLVGFRGTPPANVDLAKPAFEALAPAVAVIVAQDDGMHALTLNVFREPASVNAAVRFDGEPHTVLTTDAKRATWPEGKYMLKLFYVLMR